MQAIVYSRAPFEYNLIKECTFEEGLELIRTDTSHPLDRTILVTFRFDYPTHYKIMQLLRLDEIFFLSIPPQFVQFLRYLRLDYYIDFALPYPHKSANYLKDNSADVIWIHTEAQWYSGHGILKHCEYGSVRAAPYKIS